MSRTLIAALSCLGLLIGLVQIPGSAAAADTFPGFSSRGVPLDGQTLLGACSSCTSSSQDPSVGEAKFGGRKYGVHRVYYQANQQSSAVNRAKADAAAGRVTWMSFKLPNGYDFTDMAAGKGDAWARDLAQRLGTVDGPVWVAIHHEPEDDKGQSMADWRTMQRRLSPIFRAHSNIAFTVILMGYHQFMAPKINPELSMEALWPGRQYVDVTGFDIYNFYGTVNSSGKTLTSWRELKDYYTKFAAWSAANGGAKWAVGETGFTNAASTQDVKWLSRSYDDMKAAGGVALAYWDCTGANSYTLNKTSEKNEFAAVLARSDRLGDAGSGSGGGTTPPPSTASVAFRTASRAYANTTSISATVPSAVKAGDSLVLFASANRSTVSVTGPGSGWSSLGKVTDGSFQSHAWSKVAASSDVGKRITVKASARTKLNLQLVAYSGTDNSDPIASVVTAAHTSSASVTHTTPTGPAVPSGGWVVSHWAEKVTGPGGWTPPNGQIERQESLGSGSGTVNTMTADAGKSTSGAAGGHTATASTPATKAAMFTIVLRRG